MQNFIVKMLKLNKVDEGGGGPPTPPKQDAPPAPKDDPPPEKDGDLDELGYKKVPKENTPPGDQKPPGDKQEKAPPAEPEKVENPATGYGDEPPKVDDTPPAPPADPPKPPTDLEKKLEGMHPELAERVKKQVSELGLDGEKLDKYIGLKKQEQKEADDWTKNQQAIMKRQDQERRAGWHKELKEDPAFGGDKFKVNVTRSEKVLDEYGAELKKELTDAGQVLRPSVMRMLARLADQLYPDRQLVQGDPPTPENEKTDDKKPLDPLAFYQ